MKKILFSICMVLFLALHSMARDNKNKDSTSNPKSQSEQNEDVLKKLQNISKQHDDLKKRGFWSICGILGIILIASVILIVIVYKKAKGRDEIVEIVLKDLRIRKAFEHQLQSSARTSQLTERDINLIVGRVLERLNEKETKPSSQSSGSNSSFIPSKTVYKYLKGKTGKIFSRVENTPDDSFFRLSNENEDTAEFEFSGNEEEAIARRIFREDICVILSGSYQNARSVKMITPGKAKRIGEQWSVIEPIKIKLT
ncbi:MAG: hypothetical protein LBR26_17475 [Prevotella sp.]|nr:hypothetical protein [Prevotella sp.]